jgi:hypothetical protein
MSSIWNKYTLVALVMLCSVNHVQAQSGQVKIKIKTNEDGNVTVEEKEFNLGEEFNLEQLLEDQNIDINIDDQVGKKMIEIIVNGEESRLEFDTDNSNFSWHSDTDGHEARPFLGVHLDSDYVGEGAKVSMVVKGGTAEKMGLQAGDVIQSFDGKKVSDYESLKTLVQESSSGEKVALTYMRDGKTQKSKAELGQQESAHHLVSPFSGQCGEMKLDSELFGEDMERMIEEMMNQLNDNRGLEELKNSGGLFEMKDGELEEMMKEMEKQFEQMGIDIDTDGGPQSSRVIIFITDIDSEELDKANAQAEPKISAANDLQLDDLRFYPNPSDGRFDLQFSSKETGDLSVVVYDSSGNKVYFEMLGDFSGQYQNEIDISNKASGNYFMQVIQNGKTYSKKIVKE